MLTLVAFHGLRRILLAPLKFRDVNKDLTPKDKDLTPKGQDKDLLDLTPKDKDLTHKDKDLKYVLKDKDEDKDHS